MPVEFSDQFSRINGRDDSKDKEKLIKQLRKNFPADSYEFVNDPRVHVEKTRIKPSEIDWEHRDQWRATHQPGHVKYRRKQIKNGKEKPVITFERPGKDNLMVGDGHHHTEAYTQLIGQDKMPDHAKDFPAFVVKVPTVKGPWDELHEQQRNKA